MSSSGSTNNYVSPEFDTLTYGDGPNAPVALAMLISPTFVLVTVSLAAAYLYGAAYTTVLIGAVWAAFAAKLVVFAQTWVAAADTVTTTYAPPTPAE